MKQWIDMSPEERVEWKAAPERIFEQDEPVTVNQLIACLEAIRAKYGGDVICVNIEAEHDENDASIPINSVFYSAEGKVSIW